MYNIILSIFEILFIDLDIYDYAPKVALKDIGMGVEAKGEIPYPPITQYWKSHRVVNQIVKAFEMRIPPQIFYIRVGTTNLLLRW